MKNALRNSAKIILFYNIFLPRMSLSKKIYVQFGNTSEIFLNISARVACRSEISGSLEKSENFLALEKRSGNFVKFGKVKEFYRNIGKSQGILLARNEYRRGFSKIHVSGEQELVTPVHVACMLMDFNLRIKMNLNCRIVFFFYQKVYCY